MSSGSMEPTIRMGSLLTVSPGGDYAPRTGDIIIYRTPEGRAGTVAGERRVGRVIGVPGSTVKCCVTGGLLELNGKPLEEPYVTIRPSSRVEFDIRVPQGRLPRCPADPVPFRAAPPSHGGPSLEEIRRPRSAWAALLAPVDVA
ncbi:S26 family signal peptidase [Nonomuraea sp. NPDC004580]|uniref:S26 family signal peptidase n=1 Tax=Nonomuraea sp. NPDC004580 TaxID=3154552 RepID=UPI0033BC9BB7